MKTKILILLIVLIGLSVGGVFVWRNVPPFEIWEKETTLDARFDLQGYVARYLWQSSLWVPLTIVIGSDGTIYVREISGETVLIDPKSGTVTRKADFSAEDYKIMRNFSSSNGIDRTVSPNGIEYVADWQQGAIFSVGPKGTKIPVVTGLNVNDPIYLDFGPDGMLYFSDRTYAFARVEPAGGTIEPFPFIQAVQSPALSFKDFAFESSGDVVFVNHTSSNIIRTSIKEKKFEVVVPGTLNSTALAVSPNNEIFVGRTAEYPIQPSRIEYLKADGSTEIVAEVPGSLLAIAFGLDGALYGTSFKYYPDRGYDEFWLYRVLDDGKLEMIINRSKSQKVYQLHTLSVDPVSGDLVGFDDKSKRVIRFSLDGGRESLSDPVVSYAVWSGRALFDSEGGVWLLIIAEEGQLKGPSVKRELYHISSNEEARLVAKLPYVRGCCTQEAMAVGPDNSAYIILSPEFELVRVHLDGRVEKLATHLPVDPLGIVVDRMGSIVFASAEGIIILEPTD